MGEAASRTRLLPHPGPGGRVAGPGPAHPSAVDPGPSPGPELPAGPGLPACPAAVLLRHGARPAGAAAPEGHAGCGRAGQAEVEDGAAVVLVTVP